MPMSTSNNMIDDDFVVNEIEAVCQCCRKAAVA